MKSYSDCVPQSRKASRKLSVPVTSQGVEWPLEQAFTGARVIKQSSSHLGFIAAVDCGVLDRISAPCRLSQRATRDFRRGRRGCFSVVHAPHSCRPASGAALRQPWSQQRQRTALPTQMETAPTGEMHLHSGRCCTHLGRQHCYSWAGCRRYQLPIATETDVAASFSNLVPDPGRSDSPFTG